MSNPQEEKQPKEPSSSSPLPTDNPTEEKQPKEPSSSPPVPTGNPTEEKQPKEPSSSPVPTENWGTKYMGPPAPPSAHPQNQEAAQWSLPDKTPENHPYMYFAPVDRSPSSSPMENILECFNSWGKKTETLASNIWTSLKTAPSMPEAAWGKLSLTAKALTEGGFESLFKQTFQTHPGEKLKKTFACYLSTSTGPVAGTLYLSNMNIAFCSDRPLSFAAPSGQQAWNYYKVMVPLERVSCINPVTMKESPPEKYLQVVTIDGHEFWFMGFVSYDKASSHLLNTLAEFVSSRVTH